MGSSGDDFKKDFKNMFKHGKEVVRGLFNRAARGFGGIAPRRACHSPWYFLFYPKIVVACIMFMTLLFCGVSFYGIIIITLLMIIFLLI